MNTATLREHERAAVSHVLRDVLAGRGFFSHGEMETITCWTTCRVEEFRVGLAERQWLSADEALFLTHALYHWLTALQAGRVAAEPETVVTLREVQRWLGASRR